MKRPNIEKFNEMQTKRLHAWYEKEVEPYLVALLDKVQPRLKHPIHFLEGMGTYIFDLGPGRKNFAYAIVEDNVRMEHHAKMKSRFPELFEFIEIIEELDEMGYRTGDINPTVLHKM